MKCRIHHINTIQIKPDENILHSKKNSVESDRKIIRKKEKEVEKPTYFLIDAIALSAPDLT